MNVYSSIFYFMAILINDPVQQIVFHLVRYQGKPVLLKLLVGFNHLLGE
ncbi:hypothetical protein [Paenibacillus donghaensis]|nr:hypothetical protein [Paenibacillus donghaensis]